MARKAKKKSNQVAEKIAAVGSLLLLIAAWWLGGIEISERQTTMLNSLAVEGEQLVRLDDGLFKVVRDGEQIAWLGTGSGVGYGGEMNLAIRMDMTGVIEQASILSIKDTASYVAKVIDNGFMHKFLGKLAKTSVSVDAISGATLSSTGMIHAVNEAADPIREQIFGYRLKEPTSPLDSFDFLDMLAIAFFFLAVYVSRSTSVHKGKMQWGIMLASLGIFGFYSASLMSSATMGILISGSWVGGLANYTAIIFLVLTLGYLVLFNKNIYCQMICPMGTTQQCLSKLTGAKTVSLKHKVFSWFPRAILLVALASGLYFRNSAAFTYEPFGIMFSMVGSMLLFIPTILLLITSLFIHRPWCKTLCPINAMSDYVMFMKDWYKQATKPKRKRKSKTKGDKPVRERKSRSTRPVINGRPPQEQAIKVVVEEV